MKKFFFDFIINFLRKFNKPLQVQFINFSYLAKHIGQYNSLKKEKPVDSYGNPLPWITYPCIEYLNQFDFSNETIFEYGSGGSTKWFLRKKCKKIISIENEQFWYQKLVEESKNSKNLFPVFAKNIDDFIQNKEVYDSSIIFIDCDSIYRKKVLESLYKNIEKDNTNIKLIIIDDVDKTNLQGGKIDKIVFEIANSLDWIQVDFMGFRPFNRTYASTTILINPLKKCKRNYKIEPLSAFGHKY